jgi:hypothetical protein
MQCNDIDGINASGRAPIIMQQASASARPRRGLGTAAAAFRLATAAAAYDSSVNWRQCRWPWAKLVLV